MWVNEFDARSWRAILKWGDPKTFKHPDKAMLDFIKGHFGLNDEEISRPHLPGLDPVRLAVPCRLAETTLTELRALVGAENVSTGEFDRAAHAFGKTYLDLMRMRMGKADQPPDAVVFPRDERDVAAAVRYCHSHGIALVPAGGLSSVTLGAAFPEGGVCLDLTRHMNRVIEVDEASLTARVQPGMYGPAYEKFLNGLKSSAAPDGYTCGHFPQSFEFSTVGGWIAAKGAGQQSTGYGKIEDIVLALKWIAPGGEVETKPYPAAAIGPDLEPVFIGSEGIYGVLTEATLKIRKHRPGERVFFSFMFRDWDGAVEASRAILQGGFGVPSVLRISDPEETWVGLKLHKLEGGPLDAMLRRLGYRDRERCLMIGATECDADHGALIKRKAKKIARRHGGLYLGAKAAKSWWKGRYSDPYMRDDLMDLGILTDTVETACTWANLRGVREGVRNVMKERPRTVCMTHASHFYENGANLYFIFLSPMKRGDEIDDYLAFHKKIIDAIRAAGGSISHHHGIGRLFAPWMKGQVGETGLDVLRAIKRALDPRGVMNPGGGILGLEED